MGLIDVRKATQSDDEDLKNLMASTTQRGAMELLTLREPSYLRSSRSHGKNSNLYVGKDRSSNQLIACGFLSSMQTWINGKEEKTGYVSDIRIHPDYQGSIAFYRLYKYLLQMHQKEGNVRFYTAIILSDNKIAQKILTSNRAGLPVFYPMGTIETHCIYPTRFHRIRNTGLKIVSGLDVDPVDLIDFLNRSSSRRQFGPVYYVEDFTGNSPKFIDFNLRDLLVALNGNKIVGTLGLWDQQSFTKYRVVAYHGMLGWIRPVINFTTQLFGVRLLPEVGQDIKHCHACFPAAENDDPDILRILLSRCLAIVKQKSSHFYSLGLHETDPLKPAIRGYLKYTIKGNLYLIAPGIDDPLAELDDQIPFMELALL